MPSAETMLGAYSAQLARARRTSWRSLNAGVPAHAEAVRLIQLVHALTLLVWLDERKA